MRTNIGALARNNIYAFIYGAEGTGKTLLPMTLADERGYGVAFITADMSGPTSLLSMGYPRDIPVEVLPPGGEDPFDAAIAAIQSFANDKTIRVICLDGATVMCGRAVDHYSDGQGEKALGWEGWGQILNGFRQVEGALDRATRAGKSVVITAWEAEPTYEDTMAGKTLKDEGRPLLQGRAKTWLPGNCDIVARLTSTFKTVSVGGKAEKKFSATLQVNRGRDWLAKTRWKLPDPCPADLKWILSQVNGQSAKVAPKPAVKPVAVRR